MKLKNTAIALGVGVATAAGIPLINITAAMGHTSEVHHQSYERFIPDGKVDLYAKCNARAS